MCPHGGERKGRVLSSMLVEVILASESDSLGSKLGIEDSEEVSVLLESSVSLEWLLSALSEVASYPGSLIIREPGYEAMSEADIVPKPPNQHSLYSHGTQPNKPRPNSMCGCSVCL